MKSDKLNELSLDSYAKIMDNTDDFPMAQMLAGDNQDYKRRADKKANVNGMANKNFETQWNQKFAGTPITFIGKNSKNKYTYPVHGISFNQHYTTFDIVLQTKDNGFVYVKNPLYIDKNGLEKIAREPVVLDPSSKAMLEQMFSFGVSKTRVGRNNIGESFVERIIRESEKI